VTVQRLYQWRVRWQLRGHQLPRHVALIMDGNRRWARSIGLANASLGHRYGAEHLEKVLGWCSELGVRHVTVWVASADNIRKRDPDEVAFLMQVAEDVIAAHLGRVGAGWRLHIKGQLDLLPDSTVHALKLAVEATRAENANGDLTIAIGYGGRAEIVDAVRSLLYELAAGGCDLRQASALITEARIADHLDAAGQPAPDLIIRTSGEQRLSDFLVWQGTAAELYFCDVYWPGFRKIDFLRAIRSYVRRISARG
jgi:short-chain Z-isoprenyl diphosphate synthase